MLLVHALVPGFAPIPQGPTPTPSPCEAAAAGVAMNLNILHVNDHHSHLEPDTFKLTGVDVPAGLSVTTSDVRVTYGGFPMLASLFEKASRPPPPPHLREKESGGSYLKVILWTHTY